MSTCFQQVLRHLFRQQIDSLTTQDLEPGEEHDRLLSTHRTVPQEEALPIRRLLSPPAGRRGKSSKRDRFVQLNGEHSHQIVPVTSKRRIWRKDLLRNWLRSADRRKDPGSTRLQQEWEQCAGGHSEGWPVESDKLAVVIQRYGEIENIAGFGAHGVVLISHKIRACNPQIDRCYALKVFRRDQEQTELSHHRWVMSEFSIASALCHPNIIRTYDLLPLGYGNLCCCMEYCSGGDLHSFIVASRHLMAEEADCFFKQLMRGVLYLHEMGIAHRDLKPENLLLTDRGCLKVSDFGNAECFRLAWEDQIHLSTRRCGSAPYISPEQYLDQPFDPRKVDIWAAAIVYIIMRAGRYPWHSATERDECFRDFIEEAKMGKNNFLVGDISQVRLSTFCSCLL
ncbi:hypothetical protein ABHI18_012674 [Aspergillus niger]